MESYFAANRSLFSKCRSAIINCDDRYGRRLAEDIRVPRRLCSAEGRETDSFAEDIHLRGERGLEYKLVSRDLRLRVRSPLAGGFNVMNTMQAALVAHELGASATDVKDALVHFGGISGRLERLKPTPGCEFSVFIDYAHTPDALENLLRTARGFSGEGQRIVLLFGCGGDRDRAKRPLMGRIAASMADYVIITSDNSRSEKPGEIIFEIISGIECESRATYTVIENRRDAIEHAIRGARRGDIILLAGKGHEEYEIDATGKKPFSERALVDEFSRRYYS
jgi:UDP-N-acetylmuramyl-tripeptide synthetase